MKIFLIGGADEMNDQICVKIPPSPIEIESVILDAQQIVKQALKACIEESIATQSEYMVICSNKEIITRTSDALLKSRLERASDLNCKILILSAQRIANLFPVNDQFFWIDFFEGSDFFAMHESVYEDVLHELCNAKTALSEILSIVTSNKLLLYPMITVKNERIEKTELRKRMARMAKKRKLFKY
ncbi:hypothetical protein [Sphingobacterium sp. 18053]|uniref:hypothetical protein n=1 Tax=Sphingobacterium sp. 18053 TaxID=2681401 RepID=UPI0013589529|nr:hypothetical protein [Sphingobacterium sp. 18053]